jgi:hypothetical protein
VQFVILMKVGVHGGEGFSDIIARKQSEERTEGRFLWGYGGSLCHPITQVAPFVQRAVSSGSDVWLVMIPTRSRHTNVGQIASDASPDGQSWVPISSGHRVASSKFALVCTGLEDLEEPLDAGMYEVAVGASQGRPVESYLQGRVDKACAERSQGDWRGSFLLPTVFRARLTHPYAVFLR